MYDLNNTRKKMWDKIGGGKINIRLYWLLVMTRRVEHVNLWKRIHGIKEIGKRLISLRVSQC